MQDNLGRQIMRDFEEAFVTAGAKVNLFNSLKDHMTLTLA